MSNILDRLGRAFLIQRKSLISILGESQWFIFFTLSQLMILFAAIGIKGNFNLFLWIFSLYAISTLFKNAINAANAGQ